MSGARALPLLAAMLLAPLLLSGDALGQVPDSCAAGDAATTDPSTVVLLHGLGRTERSMRPLERALASGGYRVVNLGYPSRKHSIEELADSLAAALDACCPPAEGPVHFVTHSLGGILVRAYADAHGPGRIARVVMLSPPNAGSEVIDRVGGPLLERILGPASVQLGTDTATGPASLGPPAFELGIITGDVSINPLFSWWLPGPDDGSVTIASARLEGAADFAVVPYTHTFLMRHDEVIDQVAAFLCSGSFATP